MRFGPALARNLIVGSRRAVGLRAGSVRQHHAGQGRHRGGVLTLATNLRLSRTLEGFAGFRVGGVGDGKAQGPARGKATSCCSWRPGGGAARSWHSGPPGFPWSSEAGNSGPEGKALRRRLPESSCHHMPTRCFLPAWIPPSCLTYRLCTHYPRSFAPPLG